MSPRIALITERPAFESLWRSALLQVGLECETMQPDQLGQAFGRAAAVVIDAISSAYDEDELLASVGLARALGAIPAVHVDGAAIAIDDVVDELCAGLVSRADADVPRVVAGLARRCDAQRAQRFEYVTVSPRKNELLAVLGDGTAMLLSRPIHEEDDQSEVTSITLAEDAGSAVLGLESGAQLTLHAPQVASHAPRAAQNGQAAEAIEIDGARLGARLRELRLAAGLTQAELARRTGIHRPNIARVEAGRHTPSLETLARLASAIGVPTTRVLSGE